jgi:hypothetical protein
MERVKKRSEPIGSLLAGLKLFTYCLSVTTGNRKLEAVIKVKRKPAVGILVVHIGRYSMTEGGISQGKTTPSRPSPKSKNRIWGKEKYFIQHTHTKPRTFQPDRGWLRDRHFESRA